MRKLEEEVRRMKTMVFIQIMPMSGPLLLYYLYTYPNDIPSWFCIDEIFEQHQRQCIQTQLHRVEEFRADPLDTPNFTTTAMPIDQLKRVS